MKYAYTFSCWAAKHISLSLSLSLCLCAPENEVVFLMNMHDLFKHGGSQCLCSTIAERRDRMFLGMSFTVFRLAFVSAWVISACSYTVSSDNLFLIFCTLESGVFGKLVSAILLGIYT